MPQTSTAYNAWDLILGANPVVQAVIVLLLSASVVSWAVIYVKVRQLRSITRAEQAFRELFRQSNDLDRLINSLNRQRRAGGSSSAAVLRSGYRHFARLTEIDSKTNALEGGRRAMRIVVNEEVEKLDRNLAFLAVVASSAPFVGLFGTVWGIMESFQNIGTTGQATLAVVAPGIAEALVATALGLAAAIPAVIAYNMLTRRVEQTHNRLENFVDSLLGLFQHQFQT